MDDIRAIALTVPADVMCAASFLDRLEGMMTGALRRGWRLHEWYEVEYEDLTTELLKQFESVYVPDERTEEERIAELSARATAAMTSALPEIK